MNVEVLDCESYECALKSISDAHAVTTDNVANFLSAIDLEDARYQTKTADRCLSDLVGSKLGRSVTSWDTVCWFHLTRVTHCHRSRVTVKIDLTSS